MKSRKNSMELFGIFKLKVFIGYDFMIDE